MKLKKLSLVVLFSMLSFYSYAQETEGTITGHIQNDQNENLTLVNVAIFHPTTNEFVAEADSDENGNFVVENVADGEYKVKIVEFGYNPVEKNVTVKDGKLDLGILVLTPQKESTIELKGAFVRAQVSQYRNEIDKRVVEVGNDLVSSGLDAAAVLNNIPSVNVDQQTGNISLRGSENVKIYVDGKPSSLSASELLKQMPSSQIQRIEIITNPSAKYEADGNSGIINIITVKGTKKGYNIALNTGVEQGKNTRHNNSLNANLNVGSFNFFGSFGYNKRPSWNKGFMRNETSNIDQDFYINNDADNINYKLGFDWFINDKTALTIYTNQYDNDWKGAFDYDIRDNGDFHNTSDIRSKYKAGDYSLNFKRDFEKEDHNIVLDAFYSKGDENDNRHMIDVYPTVGDYIEKRYDENTNLRINLDYTNQIVDGGKIEAGLQFRQEKKNNFLNSTQEVTNSDNLTYNPNADFDFTRNFYSAYVNYKQKFNKFGMQLGLRAEQTEDDANYTVAPNTIGDYKKDYLDFFPSAFLTYDVTEKGQISANYSRRITRPGIYQLTPVSQWSSALMTEVGNPDLQPQYTNGFELGFLQQVKKGTISLNAFYRDIKDNIIFFLEKGDNPQFPNQIVQKSENYNNTDEFGFEGSLNYRWTKWFSTYLAADWTSIKFFYQPDVNSPMEELKTQRLSGRMSNNFTLSKSLSLQHFAFYQGAFEIYQGKMKEMWRTDLGLRYTFMDGKASLNFRVNDLFNTMRAKFDMERPYVGDGNFRWESRTAFVGFTYNFGGKVRSRKEAQQNETETGGGVSLQ